MTRELLLEKICLSDCTYNCVILDSCDCDYCNVKLNELLDEYDKQIRTEVINEYYNKINEKLKTDTNLKDTIRDIHNNVAQEMYCKGIDDFVKFASDMPTVEEDDGTIRPMWLEEMAERLKGKYNE